MKKDYRKIVVGDDTWYWKVKGGCYTHINMYNENEKPFNMYRLYTDTHYHKDDGSIVDFSVTPSFIEHIIRNGLYKAEYKYVCEIKEDFIKEFVENVQVNKNRQKKLQRIVNG